MCQNGTISYGECRREVNFAGYRVTGENSEAVKIAKWYIEKRPAKSLYLYGGTGTGKTTLARIISSYFGDVLGGNVTSLMGQIKRTFTGDGDSQDVINRYSQCNLLVLDDLGAQFVSEWFATTLFDIINRRYETGRKLIVTSNYTLEELQRRLAIKNDPLTGRRIVSRLHEICIQAYLGESDWRMKQ